MTTKLEVILASVLGLVLACFGVGIWYHFHNADERKEGAAACVQATTQTKSEVAAENVADTTGQAADLKATVAQQNEKLSQLSRDNADLVGRLRAGNSVRQSGLPNPGCPAGNDLNAGALRAGQSGAEQAIASAEVRVFNDCDAEHARADSAVEAYNGWRQRMIDRQKNAPVSPPGH